MWLSSDERPVSDRPPVQIPTPKAPIQPGATDGGVTSEDGQAASEQSQTGHGKPRPATA